MVRMTYEPFAPLFFRRRAPLAPPPPPFAVVADRETQSPRVAARRPALYFDRCFRTATNPLWPSYRNGYAMRPQTLVAPCFVRWRTSAETPFRLPTFRGRNIFRKGFSL